MKKWTIAYVNYKSSVYMYWQLKMLFEYNNPLDFEVIIIDNSNPNEDNLLKEMAEKYQDEYDNIKIVPYSPKQIRASAQHGEGLSLAIELANSEYFLAQDPDFFFIKQNYLKFLAGFLDKGMVAIGAPYTHGVGLGHPKFPALYGAAHPLKLIKNIDCVPITTDEYLEKSYKLFPKYEYSFDVGYRIRSKLSTENRNDNFISFDHRRVNNIASNLGIHSFEVITQAYSYEGEDLCYHLFRGCFTAPVIDNVRDANIPVSKKLHKVRNMIGSYFYQYITDEKNPFLKST